MDILSRLRLAFLGLFVVVGVGTVGYQVTMGWSFLDALYMTVITISTVGFREISPLNTGAKVFTIFVIAGGVGTIFYSLGTLVEFIIEGHFSGFVEDRKMEKKIAGLGDHLILCGYGKVGRQVVGELVRAGSRFVVIDISPEKVEECHAEGHLCILGDAAESDVLKRAGIGEANGLIAAVATDAENVFVTLTARELNSDIFIVARSNTEESEEKLKKAGADRVITPTAIGGRRMAALFTRPLVCDYLDVVCHGEELEFQLEELKIAGNSPFVGQSLNEARIRERTGSLVLAIKTADGQLSTKPEPDAIVQAGDVIVVIGTRNQLEQLQNMVAHERL